MGTLWQDLRYGWRVLGAHKGFATVVVLSLALGIGANSAIFSLVDAVLLRPLAVRHPEQLVLLEWQSGPQMPAAEVSGDTDVQPDHVSSTSFSYRTFERLRRRCRSLSDLLAFGEIDRINVGGDNRAEIAHGQAVSGGYFAALGVPAAAGRVLDEADQRPDAPPVAMISYGMWRRLFAFERTAIGTTLNLDGQPFTVVGVTPRGFRGALEPSSAPDITVPLRQAPRISGSHLPGDSLLDQGSTPATWWLVVMGRLRAGVPRDQARAELGVWFAQSLLEPGVSVDTTPGPGPRQVPALHLLPGGRGLTGESRDLAQPLLVMMGLVGLGLLAACANVAGLLLARATARQRELAMRVALGAGRVRLVRQLLTESLLLALLGGGLGLLLTYWSGDLLAGLLRAMPMGMERGDLLDAVGLGDGPDARLVGFTAAVSVLTGLLFGLVPALRASRLGPLAAIKGPGAAPGERPFRVGHALVVGQVALALLLIVGAGLFVRTVRNLSQVAIGFNPAGVLVFRLDPTLDGYRGARLMDLYERLRQRLEHLPGVSSASLSAYTLLSGSSAFADLAIAGDRTAADGKHEKLVQEHRVDPTFFKTMGIPIVLGRGFTPHDNDGAPRVAVVSESMARAYFPGQNPIGQRIGRSSRKIDREIVGVAADARYSLLRGKMPSTVYLAAGQDLEALGAMSFEVRVRTGDPEALVPAVRRVVGELDRDLPLFGIKTQARQVEEAMRQERLMAVLSTCFGALCLVLATVGVYGIMAFAASRRVRETGIRIVLGARLSTVVWRQLRSALVLIAIGLALGLAAALAAARLVADLIFGLSANDAVTIASAMLLLLAAGALAAFLPARRAALVDPVEALRQD